MSVYSFLYYFSLGYLIIAAIAYVILMLMIFLDKKKKFFNAITTQTSRRLLRRTYGNGISGEAGMASTLRHLRAWHSERDLPRFPLNWKPTDR